LKGIGETTDNLPHVPKARIKNGLICMQASQKMQKLKVLFEIAGLFDQVARIEKEQRKYRKLLSKINDGLVFSRDLK
jgi:secreted protein with Ig-like and vWFA domain